MVYHLEPTIWALITEAFEDLRQPGGAEVILFTWDVKKKWEKNTNLNWVRLRDF